MTFLRTFSKIEFIFIVAVLFSTVLSGTINAQNSLNNPQPILRNQTAVSFKGDNREQFFSFTGRGNVSVTLDIKANTENAGLNVDFLSRSGKSLSSSALVQAIDRGTDRVVKTISLGRNFQTVVIKLKSISYGSRASYPGTLKITLSGDIKDLEDNNVAQDNAADDNVDFESTTELNSAGDSIDNPKLIFTRNTILNFRGNNEEMFLGFTGQGKVEITYDIKAKGTNAGAYVTLLDENGDELAGQEVVQAENRGTARVTQTADLNERKFVVVKIVGIKYGSNSSYPGMLKITLNRGFARRN